MCHFRESWNPSYFVIPAKAGIQRMGERAALLKPTQSEASSGFELLYHSDQGVQYAATSYQQFLTECAIIPGMSCKGDCYNNAVIESFFATSRFE
jgi:hypothetical protein